MQSRIRSKASAAGAGCLALCLVVLGGSSWAATTPIYKCLDRNLALVYTDLPCKDGERLDIRPGDADPAAVALLKREREELDQSISQRVAEQRRTMLDGGDASLPGYQPEEGAATPDDGSAYASGYGLMSFPRHHPTHHRKPKLQHPLRFAPRPPYAVPRT
jgi:hypothetical protein